MTEWIKCSNRMPQPLTSVIIYVYDKDAILDNNYYLKIGYLDEENDIFVCESLGDLSPCNSEYDHESDLTYELSRVTHWMSLLEAANE